MGRIPEQFIDELISRVDIVELIDQRVPLQRAGHEHRACCPFHDEKTPSFYVSPGKQFYHCFGCGAHGTAVGFLMNYDNLAFVEAIEMLAGRAGMQIPRDETGSARPVANHQGLHDLLGKAKAYFQQQLKSHPDANEAISYLKNRGMDGKTAVEFGVGFAPDGWNNLSAALGSDAQTTKQLVDTGMLIEKDEGGHYDRFRARIMFPIEDYRGKLVGFGGRIIGKGEPKYLNSPETVLFHKSSELYGLNQGRRDIGLAAETIVVEGYMDVIGLAQNGFKNTVATMGTATTPNHLQRLFRAAPSIVFCFDGDRAGRKAAWKAMETALPLLTDDKQVGFLMLPQGEDPDSLVRKERSEAFQQRLKQAQPLPEFLFENLSEPLDLSRLDHRAQLADKARPLLNNLPAGTFRQLMINQLTQLVGVSENELSLSASKPSVASKPKGPANRPDTLSPVAQVISFLVQQPSLLSGNEETLSAVPNDETVLKGSGLLHKLGQAIGANAVINTAQLLERMRQSEHHVALEKLAMQGHMIDDESKPAYFKDCLQQLTDKNRQHQISELLQKSRVSKLLDSENSLLMELLKAQKK
ncbi:MAG: DNA primase [Cryomorphaceae bacterium]